MAWYYQVWYTPRWFPAAVLHRPQPQQHGKGPVRLWVRNQQAAADQPTNGNGGWQVIITVDGNIRNNGNKEKEVLGAGGTTRASAEGQSGPSDNVRINSETERVIPADSRHNIGGVCAEEWRPGKTMFYRTWKPQENLRLMITHITHRSCVSSDGGSLGLPPDCDKVVIHNTTVWAVLF